MFPLAAIAEGVSLIGGVEGLLSGNADAERAKRARDQAILNLQNTYAQDESALVGQGIHGTNAFSGVLNDVLQRTGRGLGAGTAAAGVYNSSATAGALANQAGANSQALAQYGVGLNELLEKVKAQHGESIGGLKIGAAYNDWNQALAQRNQSAGGLSSLLGSVAQANLMGRGVPNANQMGQAGQGMANSVLPPVQTPGPYGITPYKPPYGQGMTLSSGF